MGTGHAAEWPDEEALLLVVVKCPNDDELEGGGDGVVCDSPRFAVSLAVGDAEKSASDALALFPDFVAFRGGAANNSAREA
eukprot:CAMPEP_0175946146 /NCGR_PEP_ID=MMETSP0108-20121206/27134_1 /TAXON_ID=195067 ORGANISM="Goniomonas pacifica, Strain CCMP1869" /NCGR_SAMPLE_ID=MMETSP0108 /ASSEMBLY_ACC=CAM_ASM_000204 /LENGTH=80 /DNA_ID=CAMNT_0017271565 /DNA_START=745 /DNA_END=984 /DNA_ORIENTATION=+